TRLAVVLAFLCLILFYAIPSHSASSAAGDDEDEDLSFLEEPGSGNYDFTDAYNSEYDFSDGEVDEFDATSGFDHEDDDDEEEEVPKFDDKDVVVLTDGNFSDFLDENRYVMVEFYAPWCGHCQAMAQEYAAAATELDSENVKLAKVDATEETSLAEEYEVQGFPSILFFVDGEHTPYSGQRTKDGIVTWIRKKTGPGISNITTTEEAERVLTSESTVVLGFLESLLGHDSDVLSSASKVEDDVNFYQTTNPNVAKMFHLEADVMRPALVLLKKEAEKVNYFDGKFEKSRIAGFVSANKLPLVTTFTTESAALIFDSPIKKQILLFASSNDSQSVLTTFQEAAKLFKGKLIFVYVEIDNEEVGKPVADYFGVTGDDPKILGYEGGDDTRKYILDGDLTLEKIKTFGENFLENNLVPFYRSDPIPETNDGAVKIVVGNNFDEIVLDDSKDVLLEIYAPWCSHCQALEPKYAKLAQHLRGVDSLVIAKMDGTTNEHPRIKADGFPTILFFPAGKKSSDPITVETERTAVELYKFLKKEASIPFKVHKPASS
ncbi:hypothetical protein M569_08058, partial [Genlisea aurea]